METTLLIVGIAAALMMQGAPASKVVSDALSNIAVTIYNDDLAMISETRIVDLPAGRSVIEFSGVSDRMIPQTAVLQEFGGFTLEQNFDFNILSKGSLFKNAIGSDVTMTVTNPDTGEVENRVGKILTGANGAVIDFGNQYEAYQCSALPEKIEFDGVPDQLKPLPTLSIQVNAETAGPQEIKLGYLTSGYGWQANYRMDLNEDGTTAKLIGWLTVNNQTAVSVEQASMAAVAGELQRLWDTQAPYVSADSFNSMCWPKGSSKTGTYASVFLFSLDEYYDGEEISVAASRERRAYAMSPPPAPAPMVSADMMMEAPVAKAEREDLGDYKLYRAPRPTDVLAYQTKQIMFLDEDAVEYEKFYVLNYNGRYEGPTVIIPVYRSRGKAQLPSRETITVTRSSRAGNLTVPTQIEYRIDNDKDSALAQPLPQGVWRVMQPSFTGTPFYLGEDRKQNLAVGLPVKISTGNSSDVRVETRVLEKKKTEDLKGIWQTEGRFEHEIYNASPQTVMVEIVESETDYSVPKIKDTSRPMVEGEPRPTWRIEVAPESSQTLTYSVTWDE